MENLAQICIAGIVFGLMGFGGCSFVAEITKRTAWQNAANLCGLAAVFFGVTITAVAIVVVGVSYLAGN